MLSRDFSGLSTKMSAQALGGDEENAYGAQISGFTRHRLPLHRSQPQPSSRPWGVKRPLCHPLWALTLPLEQARGGHSLTAGECPAHLFGGLNLEHPKDEGGMLCSDHGTLGSLWSLQETKPSGRKSLGGDMPFKGILEPWLFSLPLLPGMFLLP